MELMLLFFPLIIYLSTALAISESKEVDIKQPSATIVNNISTDIFSDPDLDYHSGKIELELDNGAINLPIQEWIADLQPINISSGKVYISTISGHWKTVKLPKSCLQSIAINSVLTITGKIKNNNISDLECIVSSK